MTTNSRYAADLQGIIDRSTFELDAKSYVYAKVRQAPLTHHFMVTTDDEEITVVTTSERLEELDLIERNKDDYRLFALNVSVPFYCVGFLATVADALAAEGMNVLLVSTFSKDYVMVRSDLVETAKLALMKLGFKAV